MTLNGSASSDPDGEALTYTWTLGTAELAVTIQPTATVLLPAGTHEVTLTVRDPFGAEATDTVTVTIINVEEGWQAQVAALQLQNVVLETELAECQAGGGTEALTQTMDAFEAYLRSLFADPAFELPGTTALYELQQLIGVVKQLPEGQQMLLYRSLGGKK